MQYEKIHFLKDKFLLYSLSLLIAYLSIFLIFGENTYVLLHDNLDSYVVWNKTLIESGMLFEDNLREIPLMQGASRVSLGNELNIILWLNIIFEPYPAYVANQVLLRLVAFFGFILLLNKYGLLKEHQRYSYAIATLYCLLPFYSPFGINISGLPLITYVFLSLRDQTAKKTDWFILIIFPFYSTLVHGMLFYIIFLSIVFIYDLINKNKIKDFLLGATIFSSLFIIINYRLFDIYFFTPEFISHRVNRVDDSISFFRSVLSSGKHFVLGQYHAHSIHTVFLPFILIMFLQNIITKKIDKIFVVLCILNGFLSLIYGFWYWEGFTLIKENNTWLNSLNFSRFSYLAPFIWYILLALSIRYYLENSRYKYKNLFLFLLLFFTLITIIFKSDFMNEYRTNNITYKEFYSETLFKKIGVFIGKDKSEYKVASIGIHPAIARYNGFSTLDGYLPIYSKEYKYKFREIIKPELDKSPNYLKKYFDEWGSRYYILSSELGKNWVNTKNNNSDINIDLNTMAMYNLGGRYIFSANKILNSNQINLQLIQSFKEKGSPWKIYLYGIKK